MYDLYLDDVKQLTQDIKDGHLSIKLKDGNLKNMNLDLSINTLDKKTFILICIRDNKDNLVKTISTTKENVLKELKYLKRLNFVVFFNKNNKEHKVIPLYYLVYNFKKVNEYMEYFDKYEICLSKKDIYKIMNTWNDIKLEEISVNYE